MLTLDMLMKSIKFLLEVLLMTLKEANFISK